MRTAIHNGHPQRGRNVYCCGNSTTTRYFACQIPSHGTACRSEKGKRTRLKCVDCTDPSRAGQVELRYNPSASHLMANGDPVAIYYTPYISYISYICYIFNIFNTTDINYIYTLQFDVLITLTKWHCATISLGRLPAR